VNYEIKNNIKNLIKELSDLDWKKKNDILNFLDKINILEKSIIKFLNEGSNQI
jgi:ligand-binding sensor protein